MSINAELTGLKPNKVGSLVASSIVHPAEETADGYFANGIRVEPTECGVLLPGFDGCDVSNVFDEVTNAGYAEWTPLTLAYSIQCSNMTQNYDSLKRRAQNGLALTESSILMSELETGAIAQAQSWDNSYLQESTSSLGTDVPPVRALADLENYIGNNEDDSCLYGQRVAIFATRRTVNYWLNQYLVRREGDLILTLHDNIVISDAGFSGASPAGAVDATGDTAYAYVAPIPEVFLGPVVVSSPDEYPDLLSINNTQRVKAQRSGIAVFRNCCLAHIEVVHCTQDESCS